MAGSVPIYRIFNPQGNFDLSIIFKPLNVLLYSFQISLTFNILLFYATYEMLSNHLDFREDVFTSIISK